MDYPKAICESIPVIFPIIRPAGLTRCDRAPDLDIVARLGEAGRFSRSSPLVSPLGDMTSC